MLTQGKIQYRSLARSILLGGLLIFTSLILLGQTPNFWSGIWDNEKLLAFDHVRLIEQGAGIANINLARIPSIFPDYTLAWLSQLAGSDIRTQYLLYIVVQTSLQLGLSSWILRIVTQASWLQCLAVIGGLSYLMELASPAWAANHSLAALPLNHGGNLVMVLTLTGFCLQLVRSPKAQPYASLLGITFFLATLSNRILILQAAIPAFLLFAFKRGRDRTLHTNIARIVTISTVAGLAMSKIAIKTGCTPPMTWQPPELATHLANLFVLQSNQFGIGFLILFNIMICTYWCWRSRDQAVQSYGFLAATGAGLVILVYPLIFSNQGLGDNGLRYLFGIVLTIPITAGILAVQFLKKYPANCTIALWACAILLVINVIIQTENFASSNQFARLILDWENPYSRFIEKNLFEGDAVLTNYESGNDRELSARSLKAGSNWKRHASQIANGDANPWDQGKSEFYENQVTKELRNYNSLIIQPQDQETAETWYGVPEKKVFDKNLNVELWIYGEAGRQRISNRVKAGLRGPFQVECS